MARIWGKRPYPFGDKYEPCLEVIRRGFEKAIPGTTFEVSAWLDRFSNMVHIYVADHAQKLMNEVVRFNQADQQAFEQAPAPMLDRITHYTDACIAMYMKQMEERGTPVQSDGQPVKLARFRDADRGRYA